MNIWIRYIIYSVIPLLGQVLLRAFELGSSLDKSWLLYVPVFWVFPFTIIPVVLAKVGYIKSTGHGSPIDIYIIIPIILKLLIGFLPIAKSDYYGMYIMLLFGGLLIANTLHILKNNYCQKNGVNFFGVFGRATGDSFLQYSVGFMLTALLKFILGVIPFVKIAMGIINSIYLMKIAFMFILWALGYAAAYMALHMYDYNYENADDLCKKSPHFGKIIISVVLFLIVLFIENKLRKK
jgi:hypothetical protein